MKVPIEVLIKVCRQAKAFVDASVLGQMLATWQMFLKNEEIVVIEAQSQCKRVVTDKVKMFWKEFKPKQFAVVKT